MWDKKTQFCSSRINGAVTSIQFSPSGDHLAYSTSSGMIQIISFPALNEICQSKHHKAGINQIKWSKDSSLIVSCSDDGMIIAQRSRDLSKVTAFLGHHSYVIACDISPSNLRVVSGSFDESLRIWETCSGACLQLISAHSDPISSVCFSSDGNFVISSSWDGFCRVFEVFSGVCVKTINLKGAKISQMICSPNNLYLLVSTLPSKAYLINLKDSHAKTEYEGHLNEQFGIYTLFIKHDQEVEIISGSENCVAIGWDVQTGDIKWKIEGNERPSICLDSHLHQGKYIATSCFSNEKEIQIWERTGN